MIVRELLTRLGFQVDEKGAEKYERRMDNVRRHAQTLQQNLGGILGTIGLGMTFAFFKDVTSQFTDLESRLANNLGADQAAGAMLRLNDIAMMTYQDTQQVIESFISMKSALDVLGLSTERQMDLQQSLADAMTATGVKGEYAARVQMWLNRAFSKGKVSAEEYNGILENGGDDILALWAKQLGVTTGELREMATAGKLTGKVLSNFLLNNMEKWREQSESMPVTINDALARIQTRFKMFIYSQDKATGASKRIVDILMVVSDHIEVVAGVVAALMIPALMGLVVWIASTTTAFLGLAAAMLASPITWVVLALVGLGLAIEDVYQWVTGGKSIIGDWLGPWVDVVARVKGAIQGLFDWIEEAWASFRTAGAAAIDGAAPAIAAAITSAITDPWATLWSMTLPGVVQAFAPGLYTELKDAFSAALDWLTAKWEGFWAAASSPIQTFKNWWGSEREAPAPAAPQPGSFSRPTGGPGRSPLGASGADSAAPQRSGWVLPGGLEHNKLAANYPGRPNTSNAQTVNLGGINLNLDLSLPPGSDKDSARATSEEIGRSVRTELRKAIASALPSFPETV